MQYPPLLVTIRVQTPSLSSTLPGLQDGEFPVTPHTSSFKIHVSEDSSISVKRRQLPLTLAYAFTDFKSQGQTLEAVIVDLGKPPSFKLSPFNAYVALSRSRSRSTVRLLRDVDKELFTTYPSEELRKEEVRLQTVAEETKRAYKEGKYSF